MIRTLGKSIYLIFKSSPLHTVCAFVLVLAVSIIPSVMVLLSGNVINLLSDFCSGNESVLNSVYRASVSWAFLLFLHTVLTGFYNVETAKLGDLLVDKINCSLIQKSSELKDLYNFENPDFHDDVHLLRKDAMTRPVNLVANLSMNIKNSFIILSMFYLLFRINIFIPLILIGTSIPNCITTLKLQGKGWLAELKSNMNARKADYFMEMMLDGSFIKDSLWLNLGQFALNNYIQNRKIVLLENDAVRSRKILYTLPAILLSTLGNIAVFILIVRTVQTKHTDVGTLAVFLQAFFQMQFYLDDLIVYGSYMQNILYYFRKFFSFMNWQNKEPAAEGDVPQYSPQDVPLVEFRDVTFTYPGKEKPTLRCVSFILRQKEQFALVGENGAGKSTIVKLLMRFYVPDSGTILFRGVPISGINVDEYRKEIACVFQDFSRYHLNLYESIRIADLERTSTDREIQTILANAGFTENTADIQLGKEFGGSDLSGGQWQKIAVARALYRSYLLIILDEPTASLDPLSEAKLFEEFKKLSEGRASVVVTHRLASAVDADKILVLENGSVTECGNHLELMAEHGMYYRMFTTQAENTR